jgi:hypothetical protein
MAAIETKTIAAPAMRGVNNIHHIAPANIANAKGHRSKAAAMGLTRSGHFQTTPPTAIITKAASHREYATSGESRRNMSEPAPSRWK